MPFRKCRYFNQVTGEPIGAGCPKRGYCEFVHPRSSDWEDARESKTVARPQPFSRRRDRSASVSSSGDSSRRMPQQPQWPSSRHSEHQAPRDLLSSRLSDPNSLGSRLNAPASPPSSSRETLSSRIQDPRQQISSLTSRISELPTPAPPASSSSSRAAPSLTAAGNNWGSGHARAGSSGWGEPGDGHLSWSDSAAKPAPAFPSQSLRQSPQTVKTSSREPSLGSAMEPPMQKKDHQSSVSLSSSTSRPTPTLERQPSRSTVPSLPAPLPQQQPLLPPQQPPAPSLPLPVSPVQKTPTLSVSTAPVSSAQTQPPEVSRPIDQRPSEVAEGKNVSNNVRQRSVDAERVADLCKATMQYIEYHKASEASERKRTQRSNIKPLRIGNGAYQKIHNSVQEAEVKVKEERSKWYESLREVSVSWPSAPPKDNRLEDASRQLQALKQQVHVLEETLNSGDTSEKDSLTIEQIVARQTNLAERLEEIEEHQADVENDVEQRLDDLAQRHSNSYEDLHSDALIEVGGSSALSKFLQDHMDQLSKKHEAFAEQITQIHSRQADILYRSQTLHEENEELKKRLVIYEERDTRLHSDLQVAVQTLDMLKQQSLNMQGRTDQLADSLKTIVMSQAREHLEEQFGVVKQEIDLHLKTAKEAFAQEFRVKYGPAFNLLEQLSTHVRNAFNEPNQDATLN